MDFETDYDLQDKISKKYSGVRQTFSIEARGGAVQWIRDSKKKAGRGQSRGSFVSRAVEFYVRDHPSMNTRGRIAMMEQEIRYLHRNIAGLQRVIREHYRKPEEE
jgi:hypothetical protein